MTFELHKSDTTNKNVFPSSKERVKAMKNNKDAYAKLSAKVFSTMKAIFDASGQDIIEADEGGLNYLLWDIALTSFKESDIFQFKELKDEVKEKEVELKEMKKELKKLQEAHPYLH